MADSIALSCPRIFFTRASSLSRSRLMCATPNKYHRGVWCPFSQWNRGYKEAHAASETALEGSMPPRSYLLLPAEAQLQPAERTALARGLDATLGMTRATRAVD